MFSINLQSREPIYEQLYNNVLKLISLGVLKPQDKLPPVRALAAQLGVNPNTVSKAYQLLERDKVIYSAVGRGSFISGEEDAVSRRRTIALEEVRLSVKKAKELGALKKEIEKIVEDVF